MSVAVLLVVFWAAFVSATDKTIFDDRFKFVDVKQREKSIIDLLHKRIGNDDFLYAALGHPRDEAVRKAHIDNYKVFNQLLTAHYITSKGAMLNAEMDNPADKKHDGSSYFGQREFALSEIGLGEKEVDPYEVEFETPDGAITHRFEYIGMVTHSWHDCVQHVSHADRELCIRVIQIRNLEQFYPAEIGVDKMDAVIKWVRAHMDRYRCAWFVVLVQPRRNETQLIVFQQFDRELAPLIDEFHTGRLQPHRQHLAGIMFAQMSGTEEHRQVLCTMDDQRVPILTFNMPDTQYFIIHFNTNPKEKKRAWVYVMETGEKGVGIVHELPLTKRKCYGENLLN